MKAFVLIQTTVCTVKEVAFALKQLGEVKSVDAAAGPYDVIATVQGEDFTTIGHVVTAKIQAISGVSRS